MVWVRTKITPTEDTWVTEAQHADLAAKGLLLGQSPVPDVPAEPDVRDGTTAQLLTPGGLTETASAVRRFVLEDPGVVGGHRAAFRRRASTLSLPAPVVSRRNSTPSQSTVSAVGTSRLLHRARRPVSYVRLVFVHFAVGSGVDATPAGPITFRAAVEDGGSIIPVMVAGRRDITIDSGLVVTDPIAVSRLSGEDLPVRTHLLSGTANAVGASDPAVGEGFTATTDLTGPGSAAVSSAFTFVYGPTAVLGGADADAVTVGISGDSIAYGQGDSQGGGRNAGFLVRAADTAGLPYLQTANPGEQLNLILPAGQYRYRGVLLDGCTHVIGNHGRNDVNAGRTAAQLKADLVTWWRRRARVASFVGHTTITSRTTSTDSWATPGGQTVASTAEEAVRVDVNGWLRAGAPINASTFDPVAVGTAGAILAGQDGHPLDHVYDVATAVETALDSGIWKAGYTVDGLHPNGIAYAAMTGACDLSTLA